MSDPQGRVYTRPNSKNLWIEFKRLDGTKARKSARTADPKEAQRVLEQELLSSHGPAAQDQAGRKPELSNFARVASIRINERYQELLATRTTRAKPSPSAMKAPEIVSLQTQSEINSKRTKESAKLALRYLAGNIMRVARGAGKPHELTQSALDFAAAHRAYCDEAGAWLTIDELAEALCVYVEPEFGSGEWSEFQYETSASLEGAIQASLQVAASRLLHDNTRESRARSDLVSAMQSWNSRRRSGTKA